MLPGFGENSLSRIKDCSCVTTSQGSDEMNGLNVQERAAHDKIRDTFKTLLVQLRQAGVMVGEIRDYFQVWNVEKIQQNKDDFVERLVRYYKTEAARRPHVQPRTGMKAPTGCLTIW